jgi:peptidoglycan/xylan/chitin deacetylase (PgdA/CDA1 family)
MRTPTPAFLTRLSLAAALIALACCLGACSSGGGKSGGGQSTHATPGPAHRTTARRIERLSVPSGSATRSIRVPVLTYHRVHVFATEFTKSIPDLTVEPTTFGAELDALASGGYHTVTIAQLFDALYRGKPLPSRPVLITVDDGYVDDVKEILPRLQRHHMTAVFYIITKRFHEQGFLDAAQVRKLDRAGMDIGAHTRHHVDLLQLSGQALDSEVSGSRRDLEQVLGHPVYSFAYPFGRFGPATVAAVRRAGFLMAFTTQAGTTESTGAPLTMPRIHVGRAMSPASVLACVSGGASGCGGTGG